MTWTNRCSIVPVAYAPLARGLSEGLAGAAGANMWTTPLERIASPGTVTHYISNGVMEDNFSALLPLDTIDTDTNVVTRLFPGQPDVIYAACQAMVPPAAVTLAQIQALLAAAVIVDADPFATMAQLGLQMKAGTMP